MALAAFSWLFWSVHSPHMQNLYELRERSCLKGANVSDVRGLKVEREWNQVEAALAWRIRSCSKSTFLLRISKSVQRCSEGEVVSTVVIAEVLAVVVNHGVLASAADGTQVVDAELLQPVSPNPHPIQPTPPHPSQPHARVLASLAILHLGLGDPLSPTCGPGSVPCFK